VFSPGDLSTLMRAARRGDDEAYRRLLTEVATWLRGIARRGLATAGRGSDDSEDIVQETLLAMHLKRDTWDETQPIEPWLRAIAHHKLVDHLRRRGFARHLDIEDFADTLATPTARPTPGICCPACRNASGASSRASPWKDKVRATSVSGWA